ncbi:unnamed protein product [Ceutorhynchus assimilis]|uniref:BPTI/Kunitz inhibitor domain-containing protein n=1 Tax=Ceutorhynchus assimilis TaxID=467358 RepID=A0A9N9MJE0_9CUCU|nr:unnamed protein product [Ceutorhynchus assimilis]
MFLKLGLLVFLSICVYMSEGFTETDCNENHERVSCKYKLNVYTWNNEIKHCVRVSYGGCNRTSNNFAFRPDCDRIARPICTKDYANAINAFSKEACNHEVHLGDPYEIPKCPGYRYAVWTWSSKEQACREAYYWGCNGSANRFISREDCDRIARPICT